MFEGEVQYPPTDPTGENEAMVDTVPTLLAPLLIGLVISFGPTGGGVKTLVKDEKGGRVVLKWNWGSGCCCLRAASPDVDKMFDPLSWVLINEEACASVTATLEYSSREPCCEKGLASASLVFGGVGRVLVVEDVRV